MAIRNLAVLVALFPLACGGTAASDGSGGSAGATGGWAGHSGGASGGASGGMVATGGTGATGNLCDLPVDPGTCGSAIQMFYFDAVLGHCAAFSYSGCDGNANRFYSALDCVSTCGGSVPEFCSLPADSGPCDAALSSYHFDPSTGRCELFSYGGCDGNANRFTTETECLATCGDVGQSQCPLSAPSGSCSTEGAACTYGSWDGCLCVPHHPYWCEPVPACSAGTGGASGFAPPSSGGGGAAAGAPLPGGGGSADIAPAPTHSMCTCRAGIWQCEMQF